MKNPIRKFLFLISSLFIVGAAFASNPLNNKYRYTYFTINNNTNAPLYIDHSGYQQKWQHPLPNVILSSHNNRLESTVIRMGRKVFYDGQTNLHFCSQAKIRGGKAYCAVTTKSYCTIFSVLDSLGKKHFVRTNIAGDYHCTTNSWLNHNGMHVTINIQ